MTDETLRTYNCPKPDCDRRMKSKSGLTLHIKKCCPEYRYMRTTVEMKILLHIDEVADIAANGIALFRKYFATYGGATIKDGEVIVSKISTREPTKLELSREQRNLASRDKTAALGEFKTLIKNLIGTDKYKELGLKGSTYRWPRELKLWGRKSLSAGGVLGWYGATEFRFDRAKERLAIKYDESQYTPKGRKFGRRKNKTFQLADPESTKRIGEFFEFKEE